MRRYVIVAGGWPHIFEDEEEDAECRFVYDTVEEGLVAVQILREGKWITASGAHFRDVQDSLDTSHPEFPENYREEGYRASSTLPMWALTNRERKAMREAAAARQLARLNRRVVDLQGSFIDLLSIESA